MLLRFAMDDVTRFQKLVQFRVPDSLSDAIDAAANKQLQTKSEYIRRTVIERMQVDGIEGPFPENQPQQYALVVDGSVALKTDRAGNPPRPVIVTKLDAGDTGTWLPVENEDTQPFDAKLHWRLAPHFRVETDRVVRIYPVVVKSWEHA
jgi:hypothetical protein